MTKIFSETHHWCVDELTQKIVDGEIMLKETPGQYNIQSALKNLKSENADYERGMKIMIVRPFISVAWNKFAPVFYSEVFGAAWKENWEKFAITQLGV